MRGKGTAADFSLAPTRITPAYAGKSILLDGYRDNP